MCINSTKNSKGDIVNKPLVDMMCNLKFYITPKQAENKGGNGELRDKLKREQLLRF